LWFHLRDQPSAHGILHRNKNQKISDATLHQAAHELIAATFGSKAKNQSGQKIEVVVADCRHVKPIKGDRHGRVTYAEGRHFVHQFRLSENT
jgi:predicted ribosome quality control (RQC) complex YloA/Tae2 family protein